ncbi:hypothetical protein OPQ81_000982 [Rhizoctonia solani]|nr:hypothetical protein OPQ81_000982 [Rhizoctonia solani]
MSHLLEELDKLSTTLCALLDNYINTCAKLRDHYFQERATNKLEELLDLVANELQLVASHGVKLKQAEALMKAVRNSSPAIVPISSLPPEILTRIFCIVLYDQPEPLDASGAPLKVSLSFPKYPETLSQVCFGWRQIAIGSHSLWTRIDLVLNHPLGPSFLERAKVHVRRAGQMPLDIRMIDPTLNRDYLPHGAKPYEFQAHDFLASSQTAMRSLSLVSYHGFHSEHYDLIGYCIVNCAQKTLEQLVIWDVYGYAGFIPNCFIESASNPHYLESFQIDLPGRSLEDIWHSTSVLRLAGLYPYWTSRAYHQLVELRLGSTRGTPSVSISETHIIGILKASPELRALHLHLALDGRVPKNPPIFPVQLDELETVSLGSLGMSSILRFIAPGEKPLQLSIFGRPTDVVEQFLRRSNITQFHMTCWGNDPLTNMTRLCPNLRVLVLDSRGVGRLNFPNDYEHEDESAVTTPIRLQSLYILGCGDVKLIDLQQIVERYSIKELTLWSTYPTIIDEHSSKSRTANEFEISTLCPVVNYLGNGGRNPTDDWDIF